jgi:hypothetical protein
VVRPPHIPHYLEYEDRRLWKGELEFRSINADGSVSPLLITQLIEDDVLRVEWNKETVAVIVRSAFFEWFRTGEAGAYNARSLTTDQLTWSWNGLELHVVIDSIERIFPTYAVFDLRLLAVR